jgi:hypothetical protein
MNCKGFGKSGHGIIEDCGVCMEALKKTTEIVSEWSQCPT